jgi:mannose-1-phosphate guanylyltransferase
LEETRHRAERSAPPEHILYSVTQGHEQYYLPRLADRPSQRIEQASNKGTAPAISALTHIVKKDPNAIVVILPCDHYYSPESTFPSALKSAFQISEQRSRFVVLLGVEPKSSEVDYGWIELGETISGHSGLTHVSGCREKLPMPLAETLFRAGTLWNTFVMVGHVCTFLEMAWAQYPVCCKRWNRRKYRRFLAEKSASRMSFTTASRRRIFCARFCPGPPIVYWL